MEEGTDNYKIASLELEAEKKKTQEARAAQGELQKQVEDLNAQLEEEGSRVFDLITETNQLRDTVQRQRELVAAAEGRLGLAEQKLDYADGVRVQLERRMTTLTRI